ncbi:heparanase-like [Ruditapes philippinarum]|uniref:heparanase-like n=1 Tax=Ruditapes philippinarum TaxID=129788 RepID=UPI00295C1635|nr:heparanase-like [Ruditapes philippinarum]
MKREMDTCDKRMETIVITASFYDDIHKFVSSVGWDLIFGLNLLLRKPDGAWDPSNAEELMKYTVQSGYKMGGWELGNEPNNYGRKFGCKVGARQLVKDFHTLNSLLGEYPQFDDTEVLGPSVTQLSTDDYFQRFVNAGGGEVVTALTYHQYYEDGSVAKLEDFYNPYILNILYRQIQKGMNLTRAAGTKAKLWLGETSSAWRSGAPGLSDRYVAAFMWLDKLGMSARDGFNAVVRQSFYGGNYSLLDNETCAPNPDYWLTVLFKLLVGNKVLRVISPDSLGKIRAYAHCAETRKSGYPEGSVTVYVMNIDQSPVTIELPDFARNSPLHVYNMLPADDDLLSKFVLLNGKKLQMEDDKTIPNLLRPVKTTRTVLIPALSYSFIVVPDARLHCCM